MDLKEKIERKTGRVSVIGLGHVGLPLSVEIAKVGFTVKGFDINEEKIYNLKNGNAEIYSSDIRNADVQQLLSSGNLTVSHTVDILSQSDIFIVCVPTPLDKHKVPDISYLQAATHSIVPFLKRDQLIIIESTTYPGCTNEYIIPILDQSSLKAGKDFFIAYSPERFDPGNKGFPFSSITKIIGALDDDSYEVAASLYSQFSGGVYRVSDLKTAEMVKLLENVFRLVNISFINEMSMICDKMGIDIWEVIEAAKTKPYGFMPFYPGPGVGGECIPLDPFYLSWKTKEYGFFSRFIELAGEINEMMPHVIVEKTITRLNEVEKSIRGAQILIIGVAYKKNVASTKESPALKIISKLMDKGAQIYYHDPLILSIHVNNRTLYSTSLSQEILRQSDIVLILCDHSSINYTLITNHAQLLIDTKNSINSAHKKLHV